MRLIPTLLLGTWPTRAPPCMQRRRVQLHWAQHPPAPTPRTASSHALYPLPSHTHTHTQAGSAALGSASSNIPFPHNVTRTHAGGLRPNVTFGLIRRSADQGNIASLLLMADAYLDGDGTAQDWVRSASVYYDALQVGGWVGVLELRRGTA